MQHGLIKFAGNNDSVIRQIQYFKRVQVPKSIETKIQECAIEHLQVRDIGKLRDKYEGQRYYDLLRLDIISEFAFEKHVALGDFDWQKRMNKNYQRKSYEIGGQTINLISFSVGTFPRFDPESVSNVVFVYIKPDLKVYISGFGSYEVINSIAVEPLQYSPLNPEMKEVHDFSSLIPFEKLDDLLQIMKA